MENAPPTPGDSPDTGTGQAPQSCNSTERTEGVKGLGEGVEVVLSSL